MGLKIVKGACLGLFGLASFATEQRNREISTRMRELPRRREHRFRCAVAALAEAPCLERESRRVY